MSGYLEVKYPFKSSIGLNPFKSWKRQWCILRPSPTSSGGCLAVYCSEAGAAAGVVELPGGCVVRRAESRSRPYAFAVFGADETKPRVLLAAPSLQDAHSWMDKIRALLNEDPQLDTPRLHDSFSVTVCSTELARRCGLPGDGVASVTERGLLLAIRLRPPTLLPWPRVSEVVARTNPADKHTTCVITIDRKFPGGGGQLHLWCASARALVDAAFRARRDACRTDGNIPSHTDGNVACHNDGIVACHNDGNIACHTDGHVASNISGKNAGGSIVSNPDTTGCNFTGNSDKNTANPNIGKNTDNKISDIATPSDGTKTRSSVRKNDGDDVTTTPALSISKSDGDLHAKSRSELSEVRRSSWYSGPSEVSLDDIDLVMTKEARALPLAPLARCSARHLAPTSDHSISGRSMASIASGIYEEIPELPPDQPTSPLPATAADDDEYCAMGFNAKTSPIMSLEFAPLSGEPTYESVADCVYATMRRGKRYLPPPLPPRLPFGTGMAASTAAAMAVTRHGSLGSLGSLPRCESLSSGSSAASAATLPNKARQPFSVFRKRLKSDSRLTSSPKSELSKENKDVETKKKKFEFTPTRDIFKNFKMGRKMKGLKLTKGEAKSCEYLDEASPPSTVSGPRCAKSAEGLDTCVCPRDICPRDVITSDICRREVCSSNVCPRTYAARNDCSSDNLSTDADLSLEFNDDAVAALALPQEIVDLILRGRRNIGKVRLKETAAESDYLPMSPVLPTPPTSAPMDHYIAMSPSARLA